MTEMEWSVLNVEVEVETWTDYANGDQIQVQIDGTVYLVHSSNVDLIREKKEEKEYEKEKSE